jgi:hypothetical protein
VRSVDLKVLKNKLSEYVRIAAGGEIMLSRIATGSWRSWGLRRLGAVQS